MGSVDIYPPSQPSGMALAYAEVTANQSTITTEVDLTGLTVTVTVPAGRRIKISGHVLARSTVANDVFQLSIKEGATLLNAAKDSVPTTDDLSIDCFSIITPTAGTHTYKLTALRSSGSGNLNIAAGATFPSFILVEDVTGTIYPAGTLVTAGIIASEAWVDWVPTFTNLTVGNGTITAKYSKFGRTINFRIKFTLGSTSSVGTAPVYTLPVSAASDYIIEWYIGAATMVDNGVKAYIGWVEINSLTQGLIRYDDGLGSFTTVSSTVPFTWGTGDYFMIQGTYEAAA